MMKKSEKKQKQKPEKRKAEKSGKDQEEKKNKNNKTAASNEKNMGSLLRQIFFVAIFILAVVLISSISLYFYSPLEKYTRPVFKSVPYPVALVGNERSVVTSRELIRNTDAVRKFYESQDFKTQGLRVDFNTPQGEARLKIKEKDVFDKLIENKIVQQLANERDIYVSSSEVQKKIEEKVAEYGDQKTLELSLDSLYGWSIDEFRDNVVIYQIYLKRLFAAYSLEVQEQQGFKKAKDAKDRLAADGANFVEVVKEFSEGESSENDGELGWFRYHQLIPEVADVVYSMEQGEVSDVIVSPVGFHIVQLQETREQEVVDQEGAGSEATESKKIKEVKIRQVYIHGQTFLDWLIEQKKNTKVIVLMKDYSWNQESGYLEFRDPQMKTNENKIRINSQGDPSIKVLR